MTSADHRKRSVVGATKRAAPAASRIGRSLLRAFRSDPVRAVRVAEGRPVVVEAAQLSVEFGVDWTTSAQRPGQTSKREAHT
jgi:hypothetical protein